MNIKGFLKQLFASDGCGEMGVFIPPTLAESFTSSNPKLEMCQLCGDTPDLHHTLLSREATYVCSCDQRVKASQRLTARKYWNLIQREIRDHKHGLEFRKFPSDISEWIFDNAPKFRAALGITEPPAEFRFSYMNYKEEFEMSREWKENQHNEYEKSKKARVEWVNTWRESI